MECPPLLVIERTKCVHVSRNPRTGHSHSKNSANASHSPIATRITRKRSLSRMLKTWTLLLPTPWRAWDNYDSLGKPSVDLHEAGRQWVNWYLLLFAMKGIYGQGPQDLEAEFCLDTTIEMTPPRFRWGGTQEAKLLWQFPPSIAQRTEATASFFPKGRNLGDAKSADSWVSGEGAVKFWDPIQSSCDVLRDDIKCFISFWPWYSHPYL